MDSGKYELEKQLGYRNEKGELMIRCTFCDNQSMTRNNLQQHLKSKAHNLNY